MENLNPQAERTYTMNHPALAPLASNQVEEFHGAAILGGENIQDVHILTAFQQHNMRRAYSKLNQATPEEVLASKKRESALILDSMGLAPVGQGWGNEVMQELRAIRANQHANHQANQASQRAIRANQRANHRAIQARMDRMLVLLSQNTNRTHVAHETIVPVPNDQGEMPNPAVFPENEAAILSMRGPRLDELLVFYDIAPAGRVPLNQKRSLLCSHLGLQRLADALM